MFLIFGLFVSRSIIIENQWKGSILNPRHVLSAAVKTHILLFICLSPSSGFNFSSHLNSPKCTPRLSPLNSPNALLYPLPRARGPAASAGQRHAGCDWHVPADGGDGEAGGAPRPHRGEGPLLHLHRLPSASRGERREVDGLQWGGGNYVNLESLYDLARWHCNLFALGEKTLSPTSHKKGSRGACAFSNRLMMDWGEEAG